MTDPSDAQGRVGGTQEVEIDLAAFLPEGTSVVPGSDAGLDHDRAPVGDGMDLAVLTRIEIDLADVDAALVALDAHEPHRSSLLRHLLAEEPTAEERAVPPR